MKVLRLLALFGIAILPLSGLLLGFSKGPLPQLSGGFQEKTCLACHNSFALDRGRTRGGIFHLAGAPKTYRAGAVYPITVRIGQPGQSQWGFQLSARFADSGRQAGRLVSIDQLTQVEEKGKIQYIGHTSTGSREGTINGPLDFVFNWIAPDPSAGAVLFNAAGNASDAGGDPSGDYIYTAGAYSGGSAVQPAAPPQRAEVRPEATASDFSNRLINLPTTRPIHRGLFEYFIAHRFTFPIFREGSPSQAFGLDSGANAVFGFHYGLAEDIAVSFSRSKFDRIMDIGGEYSPLQQGEGTPVSLLARVGVAGRDNFGMTPAAFRPSAQRRHYSPYFQLSTSRSFADRFSLYAVPSVILNSRDEALLMFGPGFGKEHNHTVSVGLGGSLKLTPSVFLLGEYIPRVWGFRGVSKDRPAVSVGFQKNTFGHSFALVLSTATGLAPNEYSVEGTDTFRIAFNIFRRMR